MTGQRYVSAWDSGLRNLGGHWIKEGSRSVGYTLDSLMQMDHVIRVDADGLVHDDVRGVYAPEINMGTDDDGQILAEHDAALIEELERQGWTVETGWTGQYGNHKADPVMHTSEFIGGDLAEHIIGTPGCWVACMVEVDSEVCPNGSETCLLSDPCVICADGSGEDRERDFAGWVIMRRDVPVTLGENKAKPGGREFVPVLRDGKETGTHIDETSAGHVFRVPGSMTSDGFGYRGEARVSLDDARKDAEEWLTENVA